MKNVENLLIELSELVEAHNKEIENKRKNGDFFNLFSVLNIKDKELIHSRMIINLLDPNGEHGQGNIFLKAFVAECPISDLGFDVESLVTITDEYNIGNINDDCTQGGKIDIFLEDKSGNKIIIENKIWAEDQKNQLLRYNNFAKNGSGYRILYLTLFGNDASDYSLGDEYFDYKKISYKTHILKWIEECMKLAENQKNVIQTLGQYKSIIEQLTLQDMTTNLTTNLTETILKTQKNYDNFMAIKNVEKDVTNEIREGVCAQIKEIAKKYKFEIPKTETSEKSPKGFFLGFQNQNLIDSNVDFYFEYREVYGIALGIYSEKEELKEELKKKLEDIVNKGVKKKLEGIDVEWVYDEVAWIGFKHLKSKDKGDNFNLLVRIYFREPELLDEIECSFKQIAENW